MYYIAILDHHHLDHSFFMKTFAESMARQKGCSGIILHGDSPYTDRLIQTGMPRFEAEQRSIRDLNHRIITLLADNGISGIGVNGYQKGIIQRDASDRLIIEKEWIENRPAGTHLVLSNLVWDNRQEKTAPVRLGELAGALSSELGRERIIVFPTGVDDGVIFRKEHSGNNDNMENMADSIPVDLLPLPKNSFLCTPLEFGNLPNSDCLQKINH